MNATKDVQLTPHTLLGIARGTRDWRVLEQFGVRAALDRLPATFEEPGGLPFVPVTVDDLRAGFAILRADAYALRQWAQIILMCGCFELAPLEDDQAGDDLLNALWGLAYGDEPQGEALAAIGAVAPTMMAKEVASTS